MGCHTSQKRTDSTTTSTAQTGKMTETCASTLGKGRSYPRAWDRWDTSFLLQGGRALPVGSWYVEANFSFCGNVSFNAFVDVVLFLDSWCDVVQCPTSGRLRGTASGALMLIWLVNVGRASHSWLWDCQGKQMGSLCDCQPSFVP